MKSYQLLLGLLLITSLTISSCAKEGAPTEMEVKEMEQENEKDPEDKDELEVAPAFTIGTVDDKELKLEDYEGKVLTIFFFGNTCPPCIGVGPKVEDELHQEFRTKTDYAIIGIDQWDGNAASVESFQTKTGVSFPLGLMGSAMAKDFGTSYDRLVVINKEGKIAFKGTSVASNDLDDVKSLVRDLVD